MVQVADRLAFDILRQEVVVAVMSDDLSKLPWLIRHSPRTLRIVRQNVALSLGIKALFVILTFSGATTLWAAIAADMGVSLVVRERASTASVWLDSYVCRRIGQGGVAP